MIEEQQAVVETTDAEGQPSAEGASAQDELDTLLGEFQTQPETESTATAPSSAEATKLDEVHSMLQDNQRQEAERVTTQRLTESVTAFKEAAGGNISDDMAETILQGRAAKDPRVFQAFKDAGTNPAGWDKVVKAIAKDYNAQMASQPDADATADQDAVVAAVQSATTKAPIDGKEINDDSVASMSPADFNDLQRSLGVNP